MTVTGKPLRTISGNTTPPDVTTKPGSPPFARFLDGWRALEKTSRVTPVDGARRFLAGVRPLLHAPADAGPPRRVGVHLNELERLFAGLRIPLFAARSSGAFIDIWSVAGLRRKELPNAAVLAWLIDPNGSHGQGDLCLSALLDLLGPRLGRRFTDIRLGGARVRAEERPLGSDRDRVDIVIETPELLIFVEVKIDALEGPEQLARYVESANRVAAVRAISDGGPPKPALVIFLSPRASADCPPEVAHITWRELASTFAIAARRADGLAGHLIRSFANHTRAFG